MDFTSFVDNYYQQYIKAINSFDKASLEPVLETFLKVAKNNGILWTAGNGGSASTATHFVNDVSLGSRQFEKPFRAIL